MIINTDSAFGLKCAAGSLALLRVPLLEYQYNERELVFTHQKVKLFHYKSNTPSPSQTPLLVVFATVNRPEILDLFPKTSFIRGLLDQGQDVYLLDWGYPDLGDKEWDMGYYVHELLKPTIEALCEQTQCSQINLLGICQGGLLALCYATFYQRIAKLILVSAPIDFKTDDNLIAKLVERIDFDLLTDIFGNVPGAWLSQFFISLRPVELIGKKYFNFVNAIYDEVATEKFLQVEKWLHDAPDQTGAWFRQFAKECYGENRLIKGSLRLSGKVVDLAKLHLPILNIMASEDEIIPASSSRALKLYAVNAKYQELIFQSGHIGIYISERVGKALPSAIAKWLCEK